MGFKQMHKEKLREGAAPKLLLLYVALPVAYLVIGRLGQLLAVSPGYATAVFLPAGIAVAAAFMTGMAALPGTFIGSFLLNVWIDYAAGQEFSIIGIVAAAAIALASALQAGIGGGVLRQVIGYPSRLDNPRDLVRFLLLSPLVCLTSATISIAALWMLGIIQSNAVAINWMTWWVGDSLGLLTALPMMLVFWGQPRTLWRLRFWYVAVPMMLCFTSFAIIFIWVGSWQTTQSLTEFKLHSQQFGWLMLAGGVLGTGLLGAFLMLGTGYAFRVQAKEQELEAIIDRTPFMMTRCSRDLHYRFVSRSYAQMIGRRPEDVAGKSIIEIMGAEGFATIFPYVEKALRGEQTEYESEVHFDGVGIRILRVVYTPDKTNRGMIEGWIASILDVTEQRYAERQLVRHLESLDRLYQLSLAFLRVENGVQENLDAAVCTAIEISGADKGNLQIFDALSGALKIAAQQGFDPAFLRFFEFVRDAGSACGAALRSGKRLVVEDVAKSEIFDDQSRKVMLDAEARAVVSIPLISSQGMALGMISVHFRKPHHPVEPDLTRLQLLARQTADYVERRRAEEVESTLARELEHRSNNLLSVVQSMARRTISTSATLADAKEAIEGRLQALARANQLLTKSKWRDVDLAEIVGAELSLFPSRTKFEGSKINLTPQYGQRFALLVHELMTNAVKYGALSAPNGKVKVFWQLKQDDGGPILNFRWEERDGPPVSAPVRRGFGTDLIENVFPQGRVEYESQGLIYEVDVSLPVA